MNGGTAYHDPNPDFFRGMQSGSQNILLGKQFGKPARGQTQGEQCDGQSILADSVSQQLMKDNVNLNPCLDLNPCAPSARHVRT